MGRQSKGFGEIAEETGQNLRAALALLVGWSSPRFRTFCKRYDATDGWWRGPEPDPESEDYAFVTAGQCEQLVELHQRGPKAVAGEVDEWAGEIVVCGESDYPTGLLELKKPPAALHVLGDSAGIDGPAVAVVGSRKIAVNAASAIRRILEPSIRRGLIVVSGGALGADAVAHRAAVSTGGKTVVVLPSGVHNPTPKTNRRLFRDVVEHGGALISEYPPNRGVRRYHFRRRNGLIAAMSRGVLVVRAGEESGTMLTVEAARSLDKPLAAMPGGPDDPLAVGCHEILRDGGRLVADSSDLLEWCDNLVPGELDRNDDADHTGEQLELPDCEVLRKARTLIDSQGAFALEELARCTDRTAAELQTVLLKHELSGIVERVPGGGRFRFRQR